MSHHQRYLLTRQLVCLEFRSQEIAELDHEVARRVDPFEEMVRAVDTTPGSGRRTAGIVVAEVGTDMERLPTVGYLASWVGVCPGNQQSGERRGRSPVRKGNNWLKAALVEAAKNGSPHQNLPGCPIPPAGTAQCGQQGSRGLGPQHGRDTA